MRYWEVPINHSDPEVMLTNVVFPLSAELWFHDGGYVGGEKTWNFLKVIRKPPMPTTQLTRTVRHQTRIPAEYVIGYSNRFKAVFCGSAGYVSFLKKQV